MRCSRTAITPKQSSSCRARSNSTWAAASFPSPPRACARPARVRHDPAVTAEARKAPRSTDRILDTAADNFRIAKILIQMGLDPDNITYDALFNRLLEIVLANITLANLLALIGVIFFVATLLMQTM